MAREIITPQDNIDMLKQIQMYSNRGFMVTVTKSNGEVLFSPYMISNFSIDENRLLITVYDLIQSVKVEQELDELSSGFWIFKPKVKVTLSRLDPTNKETYHVDYGECTLKKYHGKNFTYKGNEPHQWYLEFTFKTKKIVNNKDYIFKTVTLEEAAEIAKKEMSIMKNTNKMLENAMDTVRANTKMTSAQKNVTMRAITNAQKENERTFSKFYGKSLKEIDLSKMEKELETKIANFENNADK